MGLSQYRRARRRRFIQFRREEIDEIPHFLLHVGRKGFEFLD